MRLPNLSVSDSVIRTIQELNTDRFKLDQQISSGQKIALPEDDGMRMGRVIELETHKGQITQYQRNASYAKEFLDAGYLNLDHLRDLNQRAQEIARSAGSSLNGPAMETYGHEIDQLIEEALNRVNSTHRKQALFAGTKLKPEFNHTEILVEKRDKKSFAFNQVGSIGSDGKRRLDENEQIILAVNGREYVFKAKVNGLDLDEAKHRLRDLINKDTQYLSNSPTYETDQYSAYVRGAVSASTFRNENAKLSAEITSQGDIIVLGSPSEKFSATSTFITKWDPNNYFPNQLQAKLDTETSSRYPGSTYDSLSNGEKQLVQDAVYNSDWTRSLTVTSSSVNSDSNLSFEIPSNWKRLTIYDQGDVVERGGRLWESIGAENVNHDPSASGVDYWREIGSNYSQEREDWDLEVTGKSNRLYFTSPDGTLFPDRTSAINYSRNILISTKIKDYQLSSNPAQALATDLSNAVKQVSIPVNQFSVSGSENEGAVFFDPETLKYSLNSAPSDGSIISGSFIKDNGQVFRADQKVSANDVVLHEGRYFLVQNPNSVDAQTLPHLVEKLPPSGDVVSYSGPIVKSTDSLIPSLNSGQYFEVVNADPTQPSQFYLASSKIALSTSDLTGLNLATPVVPTGLSKVSYDPSLSNVSLKAGQHLFDSTTGKYFLIKSNSSFSLSDSTTNVFNGVDKVEVMERTDGNVFLLGSTLPVEGKEKFFYEDRELIASAGDYITYQPPAINSNDTFVLPPVEHYVALQNINKPASWVEGNPSLSGEFAMKSGKLYFANTAIIGSDNTDANFSLNWSEATTWQEGFAAKTGNSVFKNGIYYTANTDLTPSDNSELNFSANWTASTFPDYSISEGNYYSKVGSSSTLPGPTTANQGENWSPNLTYDFGQIVFHEGSYFQCQVNSFDNTSDAQSISGVPSIITPNDKFIYNETNQKVANDKWLQIDKPLDHVFKFSVDNAEKPLVSIQPSGVSGNDAKAEAILDSDGEVVGLKVIDAGRYFFGVSSAGFVPPDFEKAKVILANGQEMEADILWEQNPVDPGAYRVAGFDISVGVPLSSVKQTAVIGDSYSFATGNKTFLDHRDHDGNVLNVTYTGSKSNSSYYIGSESKISAFLQADNNGTSELGDVVNDLVSLRDSLLSSTPSHYSQEIEENEKKLLLQEDKLIDKMGELSARMSRMETVKAHDEDYFMQLDQRISSDVDIDLSEAIMRLTQLSTAYQASLQVGSQLLNTSLLNYL